MKEDSEAMEDVNRLLQAILKKMEVIDSRLSMMELSKLKEVDNYYSYANAFVELASKVNLSEEDLVARFVEGLTNPNHKRIYILSPKTLQQAIAYGKLLTTDVDPNVAVLEEASFVVELGKPDVMLGSKEPAKMSNVRDSIGWECDLQLQNQNKPIQTQSPKLLLYQPPHKRRSVAEAEEKRTNVLCVENGEKYPFDRKNTSERLYSLGGKPEEERNSTHEELHLDKEVYQILPSNEHLVEQGDLKAKRRYAILDDSSRKLCHLSAVMAGNLKGRNDFLATLFSHQHELRIGSPEQDVFRITHAWYLLKAAMKGREEVSGLKYAFNLVVVSNSNMSTTENKSLDELKSRLTMETLQNAFEGDFVYFFLEENSEKGHLTRYQENEGANGFTTRRCILEIMDSSVIVNGECVEVSRPRNQYKIHMVWDPGSESTICECGWAEKGNLCKQILKVAVHHTNGTSNWVFGYNLVQKGTREGFIMVRELSVMAGEHAPSVISRDGAEGTKSARMKTGSSHEKQGIILQLLNQLEGFEEFDKIQILMAKDCNDIVDRALLWFRWMDMTVESVNLSEKFQLSILKFHSREMNWGREMTGTMQDEELSVGKTLQKGIEKFKKATQDIEGKILSGQDVFILWDTYGFSLDMTQLIAEEKGLGVEINGFNSATKEVREIASSLLSKQDSGIIVIEADATSSLHKKGDKIICKVDYGWRKLIGPNHTNIHMLNLALREEIGNHADQNGAIVLPERLMFDLSHGKLRNSAAITAARKADSRTKVVAEGKVLVQKMKEGKSITKWMKEAWWIYIYIELITEWLGEFQSAPLGTKVLLRGRY